MIKNIALALFVILFCCVSGVGAGDETDVFKSLGCGICHKVDTGKSFPSLKEIAKAYNGDNEKLEKYLNGKEAPIVNKEKSKTMERYLEKTKALSKDMMKSLADFILSHKD